MTSVKEDRVLDDETGTATIHVQNALIKQIKSGTTYENENLTVKQFQGRPIQEQLEQQPLERPIRS